MPNDPGSIPMHDALAFFLTWTTYGTWLPGDERGWVAKPGSIRSPDAQCQAAARAQMTEPELHLSVLQRALVEKTIADHCAIRNWHLHAVRCRTKHVHLVVTAPQREPEEVMDQFKAWCTRRLKEQLRLARETIIRLNWWTQRGSMHELYDEASLQAAIRYVLECQDGPRFESNHP